MSLQDQACQAHLPLSVPQRLPSVAYSTSAAIKRLSALLSEIYGLLTFSALASCPLSSVKHSACDDTDTVAENDSNSQHLRGRSLP